MAMARTLKAYLDQKGIEYELIPHTYSTSSMLSAEAAHIPGDQVAKSVMLEDEQGYIMAVIPATRFVEFDRIGDKLQRKLKLANERELAQLFNDCDLGAIPALGEAYGVKVVVDESLNKHKDIFFEAGDHTELVHVSGHDFQTLMVNSQHGSFSQHI